MRDHLDGALADGKDVYGVVGPDVGRFAEEWAAPNGPARSPGEGTLDAASDAVFAPAVLGGITYPTLWTPALPVDAGGVIRALLMLLFVRLFACLRAPSDAAPGSEEPVLGRYPRRAYNVFVWSPVALYAVCLFLPYQRPRTPAAVLARSSRPETPPVGVGSASSRSGSPRP